MDDTKATHDGGDLLTVQEVAAELKVNASTVRGWIAAGDLHAVKIGGTVRVRRSDLNAALNRARP